MFVSTLAHESRFEHRSSWWFDEEYTGWPLDLPQQPVVRVSWEESKEFCRWLSDKIGEKVILPSEAQWEWACRAGTDTPLSYGGVDTDFSSSGNLGDASLRRLADEGWRPKSPDLVPKDDRFNDGELVTCTVGRYAANAWGLCDMHGNAAEWTRSNYHPYPYRVTKVAKSTVPAIRRRSAVAPGATDPTFAAVRAAGPTRPGRRSSTSDSASSLNAKPLH